MSSPCKRIKLTPNKEKGGSGLRHTQESKVTSTPQRRSGKISSPDISRISSTGTSSDRTTLSSHASNQNQNHTDSYHEESSSPSTSRSSTPFSVTTSEKSGVIAVEDYDTYINQSGRIKYTGKIWQLHKPLHDGTLYAQILQEPQNIQEVVTELLLLYNRRPERAICALLKFCIDVCGFQNFDISDHYNFQTNVTKRVIEIMESNQVLEQQEVLINTGRYLLKERAASGLAQLLKISIYSFLQKLIISAHERGILYDDFFDKHFFTFVKCMSFSQISAIRHTGVIFGIKILTAVVMIYNKIRNDDSSDSSENIELQKQEINNYLEFFYLIFVKNCRLQDNKLTLMRVECIYEVSIWVRYFPKVFITQLQTVNYLLKLISDYSKDVRFAALETCEAFVGTANILSVLKSSFPDFAEYIGKRFYDTDIKVAVKAIDIFKILLKHNSSFISTNRFKMLMTLVFDKHFPIGEAASRFLIFYLQKNENNQEILLLKLTKFSMKPGDAIKQLLVEGCLPYCLAIRNWRVFFNIFLHSDIELNMKNHLAELFAEAVYQVLIGKPTIIRDKSRKVTIGDPDEHTKMASYFPIFPTLLEKYIDHPRIILEFLKILTTVKDTVLDEVSAQTIKKILSAMEDLFYNHNDDALLKKLSDTFHYFSVTTHANHVKQVIDNIFLKCETDLVANLNSQNEEIFNTTLKVSVLFANFDLSQKFQWEILFDNWGDVDEVTTVNLMACCKWYIIWSLKNFTTRNYTTRTSILSRALKEFISTCFNMLQNLQGQPLHFKCYDCLCDTYITYMNELEELTKSVKQMAKLKLVIEDVQLQNVLITFLEKYVICSTTMPVFERQSYIVKYINLVHVNVLSIKCLGNIFRYYHMYNKEYGPQIESSLSDITKVDEITFLMVVLYTLTMVYEHILNKYGAVDLATQDARNFKLLIKQFLNLKEFKTPKKKFLKLIYFAINYSMKDESKYLFLYFVRYFADLIVEDNDRKDVLNFLKNKVPKDAEKNDAVLFLANYLKNLKSGIIADKSKPTNITRKSKENIKPKKKAAIPRQKGRPSLKKESNTAKTKSIAEKAKKQKHVDIETDVSDDLTIHDSESDDLEESFTTLRV